ncbi:MAG: hypothetical protein IJN09_06580 [Oscillospiraceae bacterium]|nr:hypothetical protein [Oscillospiraceae bacterium]
MIDKLPPDTEGKEDARALSEMREYLYHLRERINYELTIMKREQEERKKREDAAFEATERAINDILARIDSIEARITAAGI